MSKIQLDFEETMEVLRPIVESYGVETKEHFALSRAVEALAFSWRNDVRSDFKEFVKNFNGDLPEEELEAFRLRGWLDT